MSWFFEEYTVPSEKNGTIKVRRDYGSWNVSVANCGQTSSYLNEMWNKAFKELAIYQGNQRIRSVLMLGLGAGGEIAKIHRTFPGSTLTVIEYDEAMVAIAKKIKLYAPAPFPHVICEDAATAVPALPGTYDLIIVDMFKGSTPSPLSQDPAFLQSLHGKLAQDGYMLVNVYEGQQLFGHIARQFLQLSEWKFRLNHLALFTGNAALKAIEKGYRPMGEWPDVNPLDTLSDVHGSYADEEKKIGLYWRFGPFTFEKYFGDTEPVIAPLPKEKRRLFRTIMWQRLVRLDCPPGWLSFGVRLSHKIGLLSLDTDYTKHWSLTTRRYLRKWQTEFQDSIYAIEEVSYDEFAPRYLKSTIPYMLRRPTLLGIRIHMKNPKTPVTFTVARRKKDGRIVAGMATMRSQTLGISYYYAGFITKEVGNDPVMTGLFDNWFKSCKAEGLRFADFGGFWWKGGYNSWKGLSLFKAKFGPTYFFYPPTLNQFRWGWR